MVDPDNYRGFTRIKAVEGSRADWRIVIYRRPDRLFEFAVERFWPPGEEDEGFELGWHAEAGSRIFTSAELAEQEALRSPHWLAAEAPAP